MGRRKGLHRVSLVSPWPGWQEDALAERGRRRAGDGGRRPRRLQLLDAAKRRSSTRSSASTRSTTRSSCARWARCSARRSSSGNRVPGAAQRRPDLPGDARRDPRRAQTRSPSRPTSTGRATSAAQFADALSERARAGREGPRPARLGRQRARWTRSSLDEMKEAGVEVRKLPPAALVRTSARTEQPHAPQAAGRRRHARLHRRRRHRRRVDRQRAGPRALARHATSASRARWSRRCRRRSWTTGSRRPARSCTATTTSRRWQPVGDGRGAGVQQLARPAAARACS